VLSVRPSHHVPDGDEAACAGTLDLGQVDAALLRHTLGGSGGGDSSLTNIFYGSVSKLAKLIGNLSRNFRGSVHDLPNAAAGQNAIAQVSQTVYAWFGEQ
jgi:hypothetical protein